MLDRNSTAFTNPIYNDDFQPNEESYGFGDGGQEAYGFTDNGLPALESPYSEVPFNYFNRGNAQDSGYMDLPGRGAAKQDNTGYMDVSATAREKEPTYMELPEGVLRGEAGYMDITTGRKESDYMEVRRGGAGRDNAGYMDVAALPGMRSDYMEVRGGGVGRDNAGYMDVAALPGMSSDYMEVRGAFSLPKDSTYVEVRGIGPLPKDSHYVEVRGIAEQGEPAYMDLTAMKPQSLTNANGGSSN